MARRSNVSWLSLAALVAFVFAARADSLGGPKWRTDYAAAKREAMLGHKLLLVNIHTSWCGPCRLLQSTTLKNRELLAKIEEGCVPLSLDADANQSLIEQWDVRAYPTQLFLSPAGQVVGRLVGYVSAPEYTVALDNALTSARVTRGGQLAGSRGGASTQPRQGTNLPAPTKIRDPRLASAQTSQPSESSERGVGLAPPVAPPVAPPRAPLAIPPSNRIESAPAVADAGEYRPRAATPNRPAPSAPTSGGASAAPTGGILPCDASLPLAMGGFCPVSMISRAELTHGVDGNCLVYRGRRYLFRTDQDRLLFLQNPDRYLPAENGFCVVTWAEENRWTPGQVRFPAIFGEHVFLFPSESQRQKFLDDPERYVDSRGRAFRSASRPRAGQPTLR